jgi:hypothetical protein
MFEAQYGSIRSKQAAAYSIEPCIIGWTNGRRLVINLIFQKTHIKITNFEFK